MQYRIQGARMLTGGKSLFVNLPDKLQEVCKYKKKIEFLFLSIFYSFKMKLYKYPNRYMMQ
jgi:hypothetical protein